MLEINVIHAPSLRRFTRHGILLIQGALKLILSSVGVLSIVLATGCAQMPYQGQYSQRAPQYQSYQQPYVQNRYQAQPQYYPEQPQYRQYPQNAQYPQNPQYSQEYAQPNQGQQGNPVAGALVGAGVGALAGHYLSKKGDKTGGTLMGTAIGGVLGGVIGNGVQ
ncbi:MAG TPA: glycine zipper 2TM domain-containing protein [Halothiobacillus sp.]|nr:glycine zipper 2TM domain-containing protein [Halothiobacillus sp.]